MKRRRVKLISMMLVAAMGLTLMAGCGSSSDGKGETNSAASSSDESSASQGEVMSSEEIIKKAAEDGKVSN